LDEAEVSFDGSPRRGRRGVLDLRLNQFSKRYIYHLLARITAYTEQESGKADLFDVYVDRSARNAFDIEHLWADKFDRHMEECSTREDFDEWRNHVGGLVLLPADVNRSYQDKPFEEKAPHYAKQNLYAASLTEAAYQHQPQFKAFAAAEGLPFRPFERFGKAEQEERRALVRELARRVWDPARLEQFRP
jgi:hypothetical protein